MSPKSRFYAFPQEDQVVKLVMLVEVSFEPVVGLGTVGSVDGLTENPVVPVLGSTNRVGTELNSGGDTANQPSD